MEVKKRILVVGETGSGKSSIIKILTGDKSIQTSDRAIGCTFDCKLYETDDFVFIDTTGLGEGSEGTVPDAAAIRQLIDFLRSNKDGFSLLVIVRQKGKITKIDENNYNLFYGALCEEKMPSLVLVTRCEFDNPMDQWWNDNKAFFLEKYKMNFVSGISICAADDDTIQKMNPDVQKIVKEVRETSKLKLIESFHEFSLKNPVPLYVDKWYDPFIRIIRFMLKIFGIKADQMSDWMKNVLEKALIKIGCSAIDANRVVLLFRT